MFVQLILLSCLFSYCRTTQNISYDICEKRNLCPNKMESCHPVVMKCHNDSCRYLRFTSYDGERLLFSRWFYDSHNQRCRRYNNQVENFVYFQFLRDCRRLCPIRQQKRMEKIITLHISDNGYYYNDTVYVHLYIDLSPKWIQTLADIMNLSASALKAQQNYFQNYRRRFTNFIDRTYQFMLDRQENIEKKNY
ncbi:unnamed protein product [Rotaria sp. Silwood2]|nr:unnamed protein product [Rotaria sp. Silwood2]CAF2728267.1 unnamed protein product [Rotaria sp. Silwood2]CAF3946693.1 unnamed protein product [Rotaria sp. Silwood2]CAF4582414.1 unnamed protein product [Rotaria sp. Silwood2]